MEANQLIEIVKMFGILYLFAAFIVWLGILFYMFRVVKLRNLESVPGGVLCGILSISYS